jgi:hypothetical protein
MTGGLSAPLRFIFVSGKPEGLLKNCVPVRERDLKDRFVEAKFHAVIR